MRVAILVTHLLGTGHMQRASLIADGFIRAGHEAIVLSGGFPAPHAAPRLAALVQLSPLRSDMSFSALYGEDGVADDALLRKRHMEIGETLIGFAPDMLITELFPFGRRKLAAEFEAAIEAAGDALVYASIRDILQYPRKEGRAAEAEDRFARLYHGAFVHGDDALVPLRESWPLPKALAAKTRSTGYIAGGEMPIAGALGHGEIIVAAGGGSVGNSLFEAAAKIGDERWRLLVGGHDRDQRIAALKARGGTAMIEPVRPDFRELLAAADVAVLQCGYNSAIDVVQSGIRAVFVPFEGEGETEQLLRARHFATNFGSQVLREADLTPDRLAQAVEAARGSDKPDYSGISLTGIDQTVALAVAAMEAGG